MVNEHIDYDFDSRLSLAKYFSYGDKFYLSPQIPDKAYLNNIFDEDGNINLKTELESDYANLTEYLFLFLCSYNKFIESETKQESNNLIERVSFNFCDKIYKNITSFFKEELKNLTEADLSNYPSYPYRSYNTLFSNKRFQKILNAINSASPNNSTLISDNLKCACKYFGLDDYFEDIFKDRSSNQSIKYSIPKCCIVSIIFMVQTYLNKRQLPIHLQYIIVSDSLSNILTAKKYNSKKFFSILIQLKRHFFKSFNAPALLSAFQQNVIKNTSDSTLNKIKQNDQQYLLNHFHIEYNKLIQKYLFIQGQFDIFRDIENNILTYGSWVKPKDKKRIEKYNASMIEKDLEPLNQKKENDLTNTFIEHFYIDMENKQPLIAMDAFASLHGLSNAILYNLFKYMCLIHAEEENGYKPYPFYFKDFFN